MRELSLALDKAGVSPWLYSFRRKPSCPTQPVLGAAHGLEVPYVFNTIGLNQANCQSTADDGHLAERMGSLWAFFASEGRQVPTWPRFEVTTKGQVAKLDLGLDPQDIATDARYRSSYCTRLDPLGIPAFGRTSVQLNAAVASCMHAQIDDLPSTDDLPSWVWPVLVVLASLTVGQAVAIFLLRSREEQHADGILVQQPDERPYVSFEYEDCQAKQDTFDS